MEVEKVKEIGRKACTHHGRLARRWGCTKGADAATNVVKAIERAGGKAIAIQADAADADVGKAAVEKTVATFGRLDVLVNDAGTARARHKRHQKAVASQSRPTPPRFDLN